MNAWLVFITVASVSVAIVCAIGWRFCHNALIEVLSARTYAEFMHFRNAWLNR